MTPFGRKGRMLKWAGLALALLAVTAWSSDPLPTITTLLCLAGMIISFVRFARVQEALVKGLEGLHGAQLQQAMRSMVIMQQSPDRLLLVFRVSAPLYFLMATFTLGLAAFGVEHGQWTCAVIGMCAFGACMILFAGLKKEIIAVSEACTLRVQRTLAIWGVALRSASIEGPRVAIRSQPYDTVEGSSWFLCADHGGKVLDLLIQNPFWSPLSNMGLQRAIADMMNTWIGAHARPSCIHCGFDLTGNLAGTCPECGERI